MTDLVLLTHDAALSIVTLNRPQRHNSLTPSFLRALLRALEEVPATSAALVLQANGRSFSTGGDLQGFRDHFDDLAHYADELVGLLNAAILAMLDLSIPVVTAVHGIVTGGSLGLILASDIVFVSPEASFTPYYNVVGFSPDGGWSGWLTAIIGPRRSAEALLCNRTITAQEAVAWGLATRLIALEDIRGEAVRTANLAAGMKRSSMRHTRELLSVNRSSISQSLEQEREHFVQQIDSPEARQGILDFLDGSRLKE